MKEENEDEGKAIVQNRKGPIIVTVVLLLKKLVHLLFSEK
jgi:ribosomal protein S28E/S33